MTLDETFEVKKAKRRTTKKVQGAKLEEATETDKPGTYVIRLIPNWDAFLRAVKHDRDNLGDMPPY